jgi:hypothetical protein
MFAFFAAALVASAIAAASQKTVSVQLEVEGNAKYSHRNGVIELRGGRGWLKSPEPYYDFRVTFEFRATTPDSDAGLVLRTWTGRGEWPDAGYRFTLPTTASDVASLFIGRKKKPSVVETAKLELRPAPEWQHVDAKGEGRRITRAWSSWKCSYCPMVPRAPFVFCARCIRTWTRLQLTQ